MPRPTERSGVFSAACYESFSYKDNGDNKNKNRPIMKDSMTIRTKKLGKNGPEEIVIYMNNIINADQRLLSLSFVWQKLHSLYL